MKQPVTYVGFFQREGETEGGSTYGRNNTQPEQIPAGKVLGQR